MSLLNMDTFFTESLNDIDSTWHPEKIVEFQEILPISAKEERSTKYLKQRLRELLDVHATELVSAVGEINTVEPLL